ncbi:MAG: CPBP family intramembrane glutamic endopeptidase [Cyanobacteriota bacterium]|nr:CPBP family intramembrane glutamic endopeptidase [Cyanobacteriota bacterium]
MDDLFNIDLGALAYRAAMTATWVKVTVFFATWLILWLPVAIPLAGVLKWNPTQPPTGEQKVPILASLYAIAPVIMALAVWVEGTAWSDYGLTFQPQTFTSLGLGLALGVFSLSLVFSLESLCGWIEWHFKNFKRLWSLWLPILGLGLWISWTEELIFRGFVLSELASDNSLVGAAIASSLIFALSHLLWERKQGLPQLPGLTLMGLVLVVARWVDGGSIGLAWGLHAAWIFALTCLDSAQLISYPKENAAWIVGMGGKPLVGIAALLYLLATGVGLLGFGSQLLG